ncbi:unnamed protein product, partial [Adineta ricciae]
MLHFWSFRRLWFYLLIFEHINIRHVTTTWPSSNSSSAQLLGLFYDASNSIDYSAVAKHPPAMFKAAILLSQQYNLTLDGQLLQWQTVRTTNDTMKTLRDICVIMSSTNTVGIVGPTLSREAHIVGPFGATVGIPVVSHSATDPDLSNRRMYPAFYRTVPADETAALALMQLFMYFNWTSSLIIYQNDDYGNGGVRAVTKTFNNNNLTVANTLQFNIATLSIQGDLHSILANGQTRIVILWAIAQYASVIIEKAVLSNVLGPEFIWILSESIPLSSFNQTLSSELIGMFTLEPVVGNLVNAPVNRTLLSEAYEIWQKYEPETFPGASKVDYYALFAFDAAWLLIQSLTQICVNSSSCLSFTNTSFCFDRHFLNSNSLFSAINQNTFLGVSGLIQFAANLTDRINGNYYILKNIQESSTGLDYVPVLSWSDMKHWSLYSQTSTILWPGGTLKPPSGYASTSGVTFRIAMIESSPFTMKTEVKDRLGNSTTKLIGYMPDLLEYLRSKMGFIPQIVLVPSNHSYNGLIDEVASGMYDLVVADVTITAARREKVDFSISVFDNSLRIIVRNAVEVSIDLIGYLKPFSRTVWLSLLAAMVYAGGLIFLFERQQNEILRERSTASAMILSVWFSMGTLLGNGVDFHVATAAGRILTVGLYVLSLILIAAYTANLASDLTIQKSTSLISGIDDIRSGKIPFSRIGIIADSSIEDYYLREISDGSRNFYPIQGVGDIYAKLLDETIDAAIMDVGPLEYMTSYVYCNLTLVGSDFDKSAIGIVFPKDWIYLKDFD